MLSLNLHILQVTIAHSKSSQSDMVSTGCCLVAVSNNGHSCASLLTSLLAGDCLRTDSHSHLTNKSQSHIATDGWSVSQSVNQSVLVSSPIWGPWPDIYYCLTVTVLLLWGSLSDERMGLSFVWLTTATGSLYIASAPTIQKTPLTTILLLLHVLTGLLPNSDPVVPLLLHIDLLLQKCVYQTIT
jgi:hypothetical protein